MSLRDKIDHFVLKYLAVPPAPRIKSGAKHIACIGDSITFGAGVGGVKRKTWEHFLNERLGAGWQVLNYGISGRTLRDEGDYPYRAEKLYGVSKACGAEIYLIMLGTNDSKPYNWQREGYERSLRAFAGEYRALPNAPRVILMTPPSCFPDKKIGLIPFDISAEVIDRDIVPIVKSVASELGLQVIDLNAFTAGRAEWFADGVHPNEVGNRAIAEFIAGALSEVGA
ncbi:MAG: hypothetical protein IJ788_01725 [Oscillospiraceae bacterium]|nr:hypothetical protein [Oscillospiraceae bacterium]